MQNFMFQLSSRIIHSLESIIKADIIVEGLENIPKNPCLFVVNHFTRLETLLIPYILFREKDMVVHSLASATLFHGLLGKYLTATGTVPKQAPGRNRMIIHDLLTGDANWVIYPEGMMVKNKQVFHKGKYRINSPVRVGPPHTGAAVLSLKAEIVRSDCLRAAESDNELICAHEKKYQFNASELSKLGSVIVPVNITYYPLRPGENFISNIAGVFFKDLPERIEEELQTEGGILLSDTDINVYFGKPIDVLSEVEGAVQLGRRIFPFVNKTRRDDIVVRLKRRKLTQEAMDRIYTSTAVHIDHLFCTALRKVNRERMHRKDFARAIYLSALEADQIEDRRTHPTLRRDLIKCIVDEDYSPLESICLLTEKVGALERDGEDYVIHKEKISGDEYPFHNVRIKNAAIVIANELQPLDELVDAVDRNVNMAVPALKEKVAATLHKRNIDDYNEDYDKYYEEGVSRDRSIGEPIFMHREGNKAGIVLAHGYLAAPEELRPMAEFLFDQGYSVYVPCLEGMGTAPRQLKDVTYHDWIYSFDKGYAVIRNLCRDVYVGGFSAGALLALIAAARKQDAVKALFSINAPLLLKNFKSKFTSGIVTWNGFVEKLHMGDLKQLEYVENRTESPGINYERNYTRGVLELKHLMRECRECLNKVTSPLLILQGEQDPVVRPESAEIISEEVKSETQEIELLPFDNHIIVRGEASRCVFERIIEFFDDVKAAD